MGRRGPGALPQAEKREQFARLIAQGFNNSEACRIVGINRRTGKRWRHGRTITTRDGRKLHYAPVVGAGAVRREISPRYLSEDERVQIADLRQAVDHVVACFGPQRLLWGSDWPVVNLAGGYAPWLAATETLLADLSRHEKADILGGTAARIYLSSRGRTLP